MDRVKRAEEYFLQGYNCSQAVFTAFADRYGFDEATALRLTSTLGGGIASRREVCGALNALSMVCGLETGGSKVDHELKKASYRGNRELLEEFENEYGSILCRELLATAKKGQKKIRRSVQRNTTQGAPASPMCGLPPKSWSGISRRRQESKETGA